jgi:hypothetical protein
LNNSHVVSGASPAEWDDVVAFDAAIRAGDARANATGNKLLGQAFLHRSRVLLDQAPIDHVTAAEWAARQGDFDSSARPNENEMEQGVADGCSPWACRGSDVDAVRDDFGPAA